jgi:hypothetical protein
MSLVTSFDEIGNEHTRRACGRIAGRFLRWCDERGLELRQITPGMAGKYISWLGADEKSDVASAAGRPDCTRG